MKRVLPAIVALPLLVLSCHKPRVKAEPAVAGYVITKETCRADTSKDFWLLDLTVYPETPQLGDSITIDNVAYPNVIKLRGLYPGLQVIGLRVSVEYSSITDKKISSDCDVEDPEVYLLREIISTHQAELR